MSAIYNALHGLESEQLRRELTLCGKAIASCLCVIAGLILADEDWWREGETCWIPHPFEQRASTRLDLQVRSVSWLSWL